MARRRRGMGGQIEGQIRESIREPDPIQIAQRLAAAGQPVPPELQRQVFQKAAADGMSSEALEQAFGMPPGTAAQAAQALGISAQLPAQNQPPSPPTNLDDRMYEIDTGEGRAPETRADDIRGRQQTQQITTPTTPTVSVNAAGDQVFNDGAAARTLRNIRDEEARVIGEQDDHADELRRIREDEGRNREEERQRVERDERNERDEMQRLREEADREAARVDRERADRAREEEENRQLRLSEQRPQVSPPQERMAPPGGLPPNLETLQAGTPPQQQASGLPAYREDGAYNQQEIDAVMAAVNNGTLTAEQVSQNYQIPLDEVNRQVTNINMRVDKGLPIADGDYTQEEIDQVLRALNQGTVSVDEAAAIYGTTPQFVRSQMSQAGLTPSVTAGTAARSPASASATGEEIGLAGAEKALAGGLDASLTGIQAATDVAGGQITGGEQQARTDITGGAGEAATALSSGAGSGLNALIAGIQGGRGDIATGVGQGLTALGAGLGVGRGDIASGTASGLQALGLGLGSARQDIMGGTEAGLGALYGGLGGARSDLQAAEAKAMGQYGAGLGDIQAGRDVAGQQVQQAFGRGEQMFNPYAQGGQQAHQNQLALSGALGQEAFDQAYQASPQMRFLQEQGERTIARNAARTGGLTGGNVQKELLRYGQGVASQDLQNQISNLQALSGQGMQAATGASGLAARGGEAQAGIQTDAAARLAAQRNVMGGSQTQTGQGLANLNVLRGQGGADILGGAGQQLANLGLTGGTQGLQAITGAAGQLGQMAYGAGGQGLGALQRAGEQSGQMAMTGGTQGLQTMSNLGQNLASVYGQRGLNLADISSRAAQDRANYNMQGGMQGAQNAYGVGNTLSSQRIGAGRDIANNIAAQSQNLANYASQQGQGLSNLYGGQGQNLQALLAGAGANTANQIANTAAARQNAALNAAAGAYGMIGGVPAKGPGMLANLGQAGAGFASGAQAFGLI